MRKEVTSWKTGWFPLVLRMTQYGRKRLEGGGTTIPQGGNLGLVKKGRTIIRLKTEMADKRQELFLQGWSRKLEEEEREIQTRAKMLALKQKEKELKEKQEKELKLLQTTVTATQDRLSGITDIQGCTQDWVNNSVQNPSLLREKLDTRSLPDQDRLQHRRAEFISKPQVMIPTLTTNEQGTGLVLTNTKQKIKSGKFAKCNANLVREECWPHIAVLKKYTNRVPFDRLEFDAFIAGETCTIYLMKDMPSGLGRL